MCRLAEIIEADTRRSCVLRCRVKVMIDKLSHFAPDSEGIWVSKGLALGHRHWRFWIFPKAGSNLCCRSIKIWFRFQWRNLQSSLTTEIS